MIPLWLWGKLFDKICSFGSRNACCRPHLHVDRSSACCLFWYSCRHAMNLSVWDTTQYFYADKERCGLTRFVLQLYAQLTAISKSKTCPVFGAKSLFKMNSEHANMLLPWSNHGHTPIHPHTQILVMPTPAHPRTFALEVVTHYQISVRQYNLSGAGLCAHVKLWEYCRVRIDVRVYSVYSCMHQCLSHV